MTPSSPARTDAGFSLLEVLVSVFVFAVIGAISVSLLSTTLTTQDANNDALDRVAALDLVRTVLREDMGQVTSRAVRARDGYVEPMVFAGDIDGTFLRDDLGEGRPVLAFTRRGRANPGYLRARSSLMRVTYMLEDGQLIRVAANHPDPAPATPLTRQVLLENIDEVELDFLVGGGWSRRYQVSVGGDADTTPDAIRLRYQHAQFGPMEHIVLLPEGS